jgi:hypothetical protein
MCSCQAYGTSGVPNARGYCLVCGEPVDPADPPEPFLTVSERAAVDATVLLDQALASRDWVHLWRQLERTEGDPLSLLLQAFGMQVLSEAWRAGQWRGARHPQLPAKES